MAMSTECIPCRISVEDCCESLTDVSNTSVDDCIFDTISLSIPLSLTVSLAITPSSSFLFAILLASSSSPLSLKSSLDVRATRSAAFTIGLDNKVPTYIAIIEITIAINADAFTVSFCICVMESAITFSSYIAITLHLELAIVPVIESPIPSIFLRTISPSVIGSLDALLSFLLNMDLMLDSIFPFSISVDTSPSFC